MAFRKLPVAPLALWGLVKEARLVAGAERTLALGGDAALLGALREELAAGGGEPAALVGADELDQAGALVYVLAGAASDDDERVLKAAKRADVPIVGVLAAPRLDRVPHVPVADVVRATPGSPAATELVAELLARRLEEAAIPLAARLPALRPAVCRRLIARASRRNGLLAAAIFIPGADLPVLTVHQLRLVLSIAAAHGQEIDAKRLPEVLGVLGWGFGLRALAREALDFVPVAGWALKGGLAYAGTRTLGEAAIRYFAARDGRAPAAVSKRPPAGALPASS